MIQNCVVFWMWFMKEKGITDFPSCLVILAPERWRRYRLQRTFSEVARKTLTDQNSNSGLILFVISPQSRSFIGTSSSSLSNRCSPPSPSNSHVGCRRPQVDSLRGGTGHRQRLLHLESTGAEAPAGGDQADSAANRRRSTR